MEYCSWKCFISHIHMHSFSLSLSPLSRCSFIRRLDLCAHALIFSVQFLFLFFSLCYEIVLWNVRENLIMTFTTHTTNQSLDDDHDYAFSSWSRSVEILNWELRIVIVHYIKIKRINVDEKAPVCSIKTVIVTKKNFFSYQYQRSH